MGAVEPHLAPADGVGGVIVSVDVEATGRRAVRSLDIAARRCIRPLERETYDN